MRTITKEDILNLNYPDFVGLINQTNVLPGAFDTLNKWRIYSGIDENSNILQVASTTGFQSREMSVLTGCKGVAFDLSPYAIESAKKNQKEAYNEDRIKYLNIDGYEFESDEKFSHILLGAGLGFFPNPKLMFERCITMLKEGGYILASPFYIKKPIPQDLLSEAKEVFGIYPTTQGYKSIMDIYLNSGLELMFEERKDIIPETEKELAFYTKCTIDRACLELGITNNEIYETMYKRLYSVKEMSNKLREYQSFSVLVLRYRQATYPNRFVELF